jgi:hypothetical protein
MTKMVPRTVSVATEQCAERDRVGYEPVSARRLPNIKLERLSEQEVGQRLAPGATQSPHGTGRLAVEEPDMTKGGPWSTTVYAVTDFQVWWGRIRSSDLIVDVPNETFVYKEDADYMTTILPRCNTKTPP